MKEDLYETLGVKKTAKPEEIKRAFRKKAKKNHPDAGGDADKFDKINKAYKILSDDRKRIIYDTTGETEEKSSAADMFQEAVASVSISFSTIVEELGSEVFNKDIIQIIKQTFIDVQNNIRADIGKAHDKIRIYERLKKEIDYIENEECPNIFDDVLSDKIRTLKGSVERNKRHLLILDMIQRILKYFKKKSFQQMFSKFSIDMKYTKGEIVDETNMDFDSKDNRSSRRY
jgi:curved DNA-binding protein CbpA